MGEIFLNTAYYQLYSHETDLIQRGMKYFGFECRLTYTVEIINKDDKRP